MSLINVFLGLVWLVCGAMASPTFCEPRVVSDWELGQIFQEYTTQFYITKNMTAAFEYVSPEYIQHNPFVGQGAETAYEVLSQIWPSLDIEIHHLALDSGIGWIHYRAQGPYYPVETAIVDVLRFNGSCVYEHWDVIWSLPSNATNPLAFFGGDGGQP